MAHDYMERLLDTDLVGRLQPYVDNQQLNYSFMGDEWINFYKSSTTNTPWLFAKGIKGHHCHLYHGVYFGVFGCVAQGCFKHCWKVTACNKGMDGDVVRQLTMKDVMGIEQLQLDLGLPSKCGMDRRLYSPNLWGSYWYFGSLQHAQSHYNKIAGNIHAYVDPDIQVSIKRSCTEFELALGPTTEWDNLEIDWVEKEAVLDEWVYKVDHDPPEQQPLIKRNVRNRMMYWAHQHGDMTYRLFNRGDDLLYTFPSEKRVPILSSVTYNP